MNTPRLASAGPLPLRGGRLPPWVFTESGGMLVSGDSGSGKSSFLCLLLSLLAKLGHGFTLFDPHGDLARKVERVCLSLGESVARRLYRVCPGDTSVVTKFHPLKVERRGLSEYAWRARVIERCGHVARILLHAWGETDFASKPLLYKYTNLVLTTAALLGLPVAAVRHFLAVESPIHELLTRVAPDLLARLEFSQLSDLRPREREDLVGSTKNRFLGFLSSPVVEAALSHTEGTLDARALLRGRAILLIDLSTREVLRDEDREIFANLWLAELVHAVFATPEADRVPHWVVLDELPVFASSAPLITSALRQTRKFLARWVCAFQGTNFFEGRTEDRLLHALVGQCGTHVLFRHIDPVDAKFFGEVLALPGFSPHKAKHVLTQRQQYQAGHDVVILTDRSRGSSESAEEGGSESEGSTQTDSWNRDRSQTTTRTDGAKDALTLTSGSSTDDTLRKTVTEAQAHQRGTASSTAVASGESEGKGGSSAVSRTAGKNWSRSRSTSAGQTWRQTLVPVLKWRDVVTSVAFLTPEEQTLLPAQVLTTLKVGQALLYVAGGGAHRVTVPFLADPYRDTPRFAAKKDAALMERLRRHPAFALPSAALGEHTAFLDAWLIQLQALEVAQRERPQAPPSPARDGGDAPGGVPDPSSPLGI